MAERPAGRHAPPAVDRPRTAGTVLPCDTRVRSRRSFLLGSAAAVALDRMRRLGSPAARALPAAAAVATSSGVTVAGTAELAWRARSSRRFAPGRWSPAAAAAVRARRRERPRSRLERPGTRLTARHRRRAAPWSSRPSPRTATATGCHGRTGRSSSRLTAAGRSTSVRSTASTQASTAAFDVCDAGGGRRSRRSATRCPPVRHADVADARGVNPICTRAPACPLARR